MTEKPDSNPALSVRVVPPHRERWDKIGRLYRKPDFILPENYQSLPVLKELIREGNLVPSITNVINVRNSPHLVEWAAKLVAQEGVNVAVRWGDAVRRRQEDAFRYLKDIPFNYTKKWGDQGTNVHNALELVAANQDISHLKLTEYEKQCIDQFKRWLDQFQPVFNLTEVTGFGKTRSNRGFAGTADFHITVNGVNILGDYKCTTDDTLILLKDGSLKRAADVVVGDEVVSWSEDAGLRSDPVTFVGDNGNQETYTVVTELGQTLTVTGNHKFLKRTVDGMKWVESENITRDDRVYITLGWSHSPYKENEAWPYNKHLSPYLYGMLWALAQFNNTEWTDSGKVSFPATARDELIDELASFGFLKSADERLRVKTGLRRVANKTKITIPELLELLNTPEIPSFVFQSPLAFQAAFISGVQEAFGNKALNDEWFFVEHRNITSIRSLQQFYFNYGQVARIGMNPKTGKPVLKLPYQSTEQIHTFGLEEVKVLRVVKNPEPVHTVAIEVANVHNHVTNGILTHNTNRTGLHADIALQLAANKNVEVITPDSKTMLEPLPVDMTAGLHLNPDGYLFREIDSSEKVYDVFEALREVWEFHVFDGSFESTNGVFGKVMKSVEDV